MQQTFHIQHAHITFPAGMPIPGIVSELKVQADTTTSAFASTHSLQAADLPAAPVGHGAIWPGMGGHFIATLPALHGLPARHLILATEEKDELAWGRRGEEVPGATSHHDGRANTQALLEHGDHPAAIWAAAYQADGHNDFYLPSRFELLMCYLAAPQLFQQSGWYWSSTQYSRNSAWWQDFENGYSYDNGKVNELRARPVRTIHL
ncbi:DUF1566 domain-containing protein [Comamonas aquatica]|uniref:DUF1566 domain-containing protein n=1 Tax=Comamonas aquatica TaxID=225991 RepID=A0AA42W1N6_9BURK|nr:hypothetical protein [Comamonas aquatica]MDH1429127.1 DUF1566 domain-containing protein [Comamonas aquatica]MDH1605004.1 DUF1566 domain-containing protein [Comamonas aquatica]MDH1616028.1 DUF1566 domain-containing protein [Comamonas aquatica]MDH2004893.1 DUF1566 domain-containing protein [Comamonas aquatica]